MQQMHHIWAMLKKNKVVSSFKYFMCIVYLCVCVCVCVCACDVGVGVEKEGFCSID